MSEHPSSTHQVEKQATGGAIGDNIDAANEGSADSHSVSLDGQLQGQDAVADDSRKVITLCGGFSRVEHPKNSGPETILKGKKIQDHVANIREVIELTRFVLKLQFVALEFGERQRLDRK